jgi:hypothetical protein
VQHADVWKPREGVAPQGACRRLDEPVCRHRENRFSSQPAHFDVIHRAFAAIVENVRYLLPRPPDVFDIEVPLGGDPPRRQIGRCSRPRICRSRGAFGRPFPFQRSASDAKKTRNPHRPVEFPSSRASCPVDIGDWLPASKPARFPTRGPGRHPYLSVSKSDHANARVSGYSATSQIRRSLRSRVT